MCFISLHVGATRMMSTFRMVFRLVVVWDVFDAMTDSSTNYDKLAQDALKQYNAGAAADKKIKK